MSPALTLQQAQLQLQELLGECRMSHALSGLRAACCDLCPQATLTLSAASSQLGSGSCCAAGIPPHRQLLLQGAKLLQELSRPLLRNGVTQGSSLTLAPALEAAVSSGPPLLSAPLGHTYRMHLAYAHCS